MFFTEPRLAKILKIGLYLAPLTIFLFYPRTFFPMVTLKFSVFFVIIELCAGLWFWLILFHPQYRIRKNIIASVFLALLIVITIASMLGINPHRSFWSNQDRLSGLFALWHFFLYFIMLYSLRRQINWQKYLMYLFGISVAVSLFAFIQKFAPGIFLSGEASRPGSFLGNPAFLAGYLLFTIFLGLYLASRSQRRIRLLYLVGVLIEVIALVMSNTRGALLGLILGALALLAYKTYTAHKLAPTAASGAYRSYLRNPYAIVLAILVILVGIFYFTRSADLWQQVPGVDRLATISADDSSINNRLVAWNIALKGFSDHPILGNGWESFKYVLDSYYEPNLFRSGLSETSWDKPHNAFLEYLVAGGLLGLLAYLGVFIAAFYILIKKSPSEFRPFGTSLLVGYIIHSFFFFDTFGTFLMFAIVLAFIAHHEGEPVSAQSQSSLGLSALKIGVGSLVTIAALYGLFLQTKIVYANHREWSGYNYFINLYPLDAITNYEQALEVAQPYINDVRARYLQSLSQAVAQMEIPQAKDHAEFAINEFRKTFVADPTNYTLHLVLAEAKLKFGASINRQFYNGSQADIERALNFSPRRQANLYVLARIKYLQGDTGAAVKIMEQAVALDPLSADPHYYFGLLLLQSGQPSTRTHAELTRAVELGYVPKDSVEAMILGDYFGDHENYDIALHYYRYISTYSPRNPDGYLKQGLVYMFMEDPEAAKPFFEKVLELSPGLKDSPSYAPFRPYFEAAGL